jgi:hypothetical protein
VDEVVDVPTTDTQSAFTSLSTVTRATRPLPSTTTRGWQATTANRHANRQGRSRTGAHSSR